MSRLYWHIASRFCVSLSSFRSVLPICLASASSSRTSSVSSGLPPPLLVPHHAVRRPGDSSVYIGRPMVILTPTQQHKMMQRDSKRRKCIGCLVLLLVLAGVITAITLTLKYAKKL
ncbi:hypothetical protein DPMN_099756 [Dreissena polymorpha]|uniref:Uncharacterized protein n=1 Tax=Dreissena polymorpha TaxID=45954 RepID=A0A9D4LHV7_DREPO|nr:hypothetical protein DPMN_099756 [Dreissena polymorpha]